MPFPSQLDCTISIVAACKNFNFFDSMSQRAIIIQIYFVAEVSRIKSFHGLCSHDSVSGNLNKEIAESVYERAHTFNLPRPTIRGEPILPSDLKAYLRKRGLFLECYCLLLSQKTPRSCRLVVSATFLHFATGGPPFVEWPVSRIYFESKGGCTKE